MVRNITPSEANEALRIVADNMNYIHKAIDSAPFVDLPTELVNSEHTHIIKRFHNLKLVTQKFAPAKYPIVTRLEKIAKEHKQGRLSDNGAVSAIKKIANQNGLDKQLIIACERSMNQAKIHKVKIAPLNLGAPSILPKTKKHKLSDSKGKLKPFGLDMGPKPRQSKKSNSSGLAKFKLESFAFGNQNKSHPRQRMKKNKKSPFGHLFGGNH